MGIYTSPIVFTRHIDALSRCQPSDIFIPTLLYGHPIDKNYMEILHGPPGTGKTYTIIERLKSLLKTTRDKILVTAPSNVGVINLYNRAVDAKLSCTIITSASKLPPNTVVRDNLTNNRPNNRIFFSTVSMRNNRMLADKKFHTIILDEAAQCPEAWTWGVVSERGPPIHHGGRPMPAALDGIDGRTETEPPHQFDGTVDAIGRPINSVGHATPHAPRHCGVPQQRIL